VPPPPAEVLLRAWEQGTGAPPAGRALAMLATADPAAAPHGLAELPVGERDGRLLGLREAVFGPTLACLATCPACGEDAELTLTVARLRDGCPEPAAGRLTVTVGGVEVRCRLPAGGDLVAASGAPGVEEGRRRLLAACVVEARRGRRRLDPGQLDETVTAAVAAAMAAADPMADIGLDLACPSCGHRWQAPFDIAAFLWAELDAWARRLLDEVHTLASAYGWSETEILAMSSWRRTAYLDRIAGGAP